MTNLQSRARVKKAKLTKAVKQNKSTRQTQEMPLSIVDTTSEDNQPLTYFSTQKEITNTE